MTTKMTHCSHVLMPSTGHFSGEEMTVESRIQKTFVLFSDGFLKDFELNRSENFIKMFQFKDEIIHFLLTHK